MTSYSKRLLVLLVAAVVGAMAGFKFGHFPAIEAAMKPDQPFEMHTADSLNEAKTRFDNISEPTRTLYAAQQLRDVPFFLANAVLIASVLLLAIGPGKPKWHYGLFLTIPLLLVISESVENYALWGWLRDGGPTAWTLKLAGSATKVKFGSVFAAPVALVVALSIRFLGRKKQTISPTGED